MKKALVLTVILGGLAFVAYQVIKQVKLLGDYCIDFVGYTIKKLSPQQIIVDIHLSIANKSDIKVKITSYDFNAYVNGVHLGNIKKELAQTVAAKSKSVITVPISFNPGQVLKASIQSSILQQLLISPKQLKVRLQGVISVSNANLITLENIPVDYESTLEEMTRDSSKC